MQQTGFPRNEKFFPVLGSWPGEPFKAITPKDFGTFYPVVDSVKWLEDICDICSRLRPNTISDVQIRVKDIADKESRMKIINEAAQVVENYNRGIDDLQKVSVI